MIMHEASFGVCFSCVTSFLMAHNGQPRRDFPPGFFYFQNLNSKSPNAQTCIKLAAFYTIKREMFGDGAPIDPPAPDSGYSASAGPVNQQPETYVDFDSGTEFSLAIDGKDAYAVWGIMDELLSVLRATNPRLYDGVISEIEEI